MKSTILLDHHLKQLKLPTILREYASIAKVCAQEQADYPTYLLKLVERELIEREQKAAQRRIKAAQFPVIKTLDSFDFTLQPSINEHLVHPFWAKGGPDSLCNCFCRQDVLPLSILTCLSLASFL